MLLDHQTNRAVVDGVRAGGILLVMFFHVLVLYAHVIEPVSRAALIDTFPWIFNIAWQALGSEVVFLSSGFLVSYLLFRELARTGRLRLRDYLVKRGARILPLYFFALGLYLLWDALLAPPVDVSATKLLLNLAFVSELFGSEPIILVGWSLELLVQMYVLLPLLALWVHRSSRPLLIMGALLVLSVTTRFVVLLNDPESYRLPLAVLLQDLSSATETQADLYYLIWFRATPFILGLMLAWMAVYRERWLAAAAQTPMRALGLTLLGLLLVAASSALPLHDIDSFVYQVDDRFWLWFWTLQRGVLSVGIALLMVSAWYAARQRTWLPTRLMALRLWGVFSRNIYSIYLFHPLAIVIATILVFRTVDLEVLESRPVSNLQVLGVFLLTAAIAAGLASIITRFIEQPSQRWLRRRLLKSDPPAPAGSVGAVGGRGTR